LRNGGIDRHNQFPSRFTFFIEKYDCQITIKFNPPKLKLFKRTSLLFKEALAVGFILFKLLRTHFRSGCYQRCPVSPNLPKPNSDVLLYTTTNTNQRWKEIFSASIKITLKLPNKKATYLFKVNGLVN